MNRHDDAQAREQAEREARDRIRTILETDRWPTGLPLIPAERRALLDNARRAGIDVGAVR